MEKRDSLVDLLMGTAERPSHPKPPPVPKPHGKGTQIIRRRASTVSSPYGTPKKTPTKIPPGTTVQVHKKRKSYESDSIVDASGRNMTDLKDELVRVCKSLRDARSDKDELRYEVTRLRKLVDKKEKEVEDLLTGGYVGQKDRSRLTGASTKQDNLLALSSLKHRIHTLERNLRIKEEELSSVRRDIKTSRLKELETEKDVYYSEIIRLQTVTDTLKSEVSGEVPQSKKYMRNKMAEQNITIREMKEKISAKNNELANLKKQLGLWRKGKVHVDEHETDERKYLFSNYSKMTQGEVISRLIDSEMKVQDIETKHQSLSEGNKETKSKHRRILDAKDKDISNHITKIAGLDSKLNDIQKENKKLRDQCLEYRSVMEKTRKDLSDARETVSTLKAEKCQIENSLKEGTPRIEEMTVRQNLKQIPSKKKGHRTKSSSLTQQQAASVIQNTWKQHVSTKKQKVFERDNEKITRSIQSIFRSHKTRSELVRLEDINAITVLQNIFRGHRTRELF